MTIKILRIHRFCKCMKFPLTMNSKAMAGWVGVEGGGDMTGVAWYRDIICCTAHQPIEMFYNDDIITDPCDINLPSDINIC